MKAWKVNVTYLNGDVEVFDAKSHMILDYVAVKTQESTKYFASNFPTLRLLTLDDMSYTIPVAVIKKIDSVEVSVEVKEEKDGSKKR